MNLLCLFGHNWNGCTCRRCGITREHNWDGCTCRNCETTREHDWTGGCGSKCRNCEATREHNWDGCTCRNCETTREHDWTGGCGSKCRRCGVTREHDWDGYICKRCSAIDQVKAQSEEKRFLHEFMNNYNINEHFNQIKRLNDEHKKNKIEAIPASTIKTGKVYVLGSKMHRDMIKIGFTQGSVIDRLKRLNNPTQIDMLNKNRVRYEEFGLYILDEYNANELDEIHAHYELASNGRYVGLGEMFKCNRQELHQLFTNITLAPIGRFNIMAQTDRTAGALKDGSLSGMRFAYIPPTGEKGFLMGSPADEPERREDEIQHRVILTKGFYMQTTEVTQGQWKAVMGSTNNLSYFNNGEDHCPVKQVSWDDVQTFVTMLNAKGDGTYRLPTEAEWEYACRAGTTGAYAGNLDDMGWYKNNSSRTSHPVAQKQPNSWGLHDMHGNVYEWCQDWYASYSTAAVINPVGPGTGSYRVIRGGFWGSNAYCRSAFRYNGNPSYRGVDLGFRLVCLAGH